MIPTLAGLPARERLERWLDGELPAGPPKQPCELSCREIVAPIRCLHIQNGQCDIEVLRPERLRDAKLGQGDGILVETERRVVGDPGDIGSRRDSIEVPRAV